jgi:hypothetical protein
MFKLNFAGPPILLGANDSLIMDEIEAMHHVSGRHMISAHSGPSNREGDDDERANGSRVSCPCIV